MRTRVHAPLAAAPPASQVAVEPDAPQRPPGAGGGAVANLLLAALHLPQRPIGTTERSPETTVSRFSSLALFRARRHVDLGALCGEPLPRHRPRGVCSPNGRPPCRDRPADRRAERAQPRRDARLLPRGLSERAAAVSGPHV